MQNCRLINGTWEKGCGISLCNIVQILFLSGLPKGVCLWSPLYHPRRIGRGIGFSSRARNRWSSRGDSWTNQRLPLEGANEQSDYNSIITYYTTGLRSKVVNMLIWWALTIIWVQHWWLELWRIWDWIPFQGVRTDCPYFLWFILLG